MTETMMQTETIREVLHKSEAGNATFPEVVERLLEAGVESYFADYVSGLQTFYMPGGETHVEKRTLPIVPVAAEFSKDGVVAAIRGAQADRVRYPQFVKLTAGAGVAAYWVFLTGRRVVYFGRKGEMHIEEFSPVRD